MDAMRVQKSLAAPCANAQAPLVKNDHHAIVRWRLNVVVCIGGAGMLTATDELPPF